MIEFIKFSQSHIIFVATKITKYFDDKKHVNEAQGLEKRFDYDSEIENLKDKIKQEINYTLKQRNLS